MRAIVHFDIQHTPIAVCFTGHTHCNDDTLVLCTYISMVSTYITFVIPKTNRSQRTHQLECFIFTFVCLVIVEKPLITASTISNGEFCFH